MPGIVTNLKADRNNAKRILTLTWSAPKESNGKLVGYLIQYESNKMHINQKTRDSHFVIEHLVTGTVISNVRVSAENTVGIGSSVSLNRKKTVFGIKNIKTGKYSKT